MSDMWNALFAFLTTPYFNYNGVEFSLWDVLTADFICCIIGIAIYHVFLFWVNRER